MFSTFVLPDVPISIFWVFVALAILIQGISKSGFAGGAGILSLPLMMLVMPVDLVSATMLPLLILCDINAIYHHWDNKVWRKVLEMYLPSIIGILLGAWVWYRVGQEGIESFERPIKLFVGIIALLFAIYIFVKEAALHWVEQYRPGLRVAIPTGIAAGFCSAIAHAAGPIVNLYVFAQGLGKSLFVGTVAWTFALINITKLPFFFGVGLMQKDVLLFDLVLIPLVPIGSYMGKWMHTRVSEKLFNRIIFVLVLLAAIQLIFDINVIQISLAMIMGKA